MMGGSSTSGPNLGSSSVSRPGRGGASTSSNPASSGRLVDSRPIRDPAWQRAAQAEIYEYLLSTKTDVELTFLTPKVMKEPTMKQFEEIWKFLVYELDPDFVLGGDAAAAATAKVTDELSPVMKDLGYPFVDSFTKSMLTTITAPHAWFVGLGMLHWMVRLAKAKADWLFDNEDDVYVMEVDQINTMDDKPEIRHVLEFDFLAKSYSKFFQEGEAADYAEEEQQLIDRYHDRFQAQEEQVQAYEGKIATMLKEIDAIKSRPAPLSIACKNLEDAQKKIDECKQGIQSATSRVDKLQRQIAVFTEDVERRRGERRDLDTKQKDIRRQIEQQNLTPEDIERITNEERQLSNALATLNAKLAQVTKTVNDYEVQVARKTDEAEDLLATYDELLVQCGLDADTPPAPISDAQLRVQLYSGRADPRDMIQGPDLRGVVRPALMKFKGAKAAEAVQLEGENDDLSATLETRTRAVQELEAQMKDLEGQRRTIERSIATAQQRMDAEIDRARRANNELEERNRAMEDHLNVGQGARTAELKNLEIEFQSVQARVKKCKAEYLASIIAKCEDIGKTVQSVSNVLHDLELAADAVETRLAKAALQTELALKNGGVLPAALNGSLSGHQGEGEGDRDGDGEMTEQLAAVMEVHAQGLAQRTQDKAAAMEVDAA
ncbi:hypothetical protein DL93DRAFT_2083544 [Clavulina sp. PMI_390]|nr:hypothetical protein DL93DRAFT_2083544 [Clavulina sp. PMI_390]